ncbi:hypothetical protein NDU88_001251 [Pleurodeles waltl]|uniref:Uncharacterized protein n=1 Tax=Pleurodeles waltl TaxID=8319 RepID=A0AAV7LX49_PLEWA|nr:hypothetical protein NDU88_001251 [Pleurodeles waltl]
MLSLSRAGRGNVIASILKHFQALEGIVQSQRAATAGAGQLKSASPGVRVLPGARPATPLHRSDMVMSQVIVAGRASDASFQRPQSTGAHRCGWARELAWD